MESYRAPDRRQLLLEHLKRAGSFMMDILAEHGNHVAISTIPLDPTRMYGMPQTAFHHPTESRPLSVVRIEDITDRQ
jgi:hypothetical protein